MTKSLSKEPKLLTPTELELMTILWRLEGGTVNDVVGQLPKERKLAYTSVSTILRILEQKKIVGSRKEGRGHVYFPKIKKQDYEATSLNHLVKRVFDGEPGALVKRLIETKGLTQEDVETLKALLESYPS